MDAWTTRNGAGIGQSNDPNLKVVGSYFTLQPVTPNGTDPYSFDTEYKFNAKPVGSSLDHVMAQQLSPSGTPLFMRVGNRNDSPQSAISYLKSDAAATRRRTLFRHRHGDEGLHRPDRPVSSGARCPPTRAAIRGKKVTRPRQRRASKTSSART